MKTNKRLPLLGLALGGVLAIAPPSLAVSYFPMSDTDLARLAPVVVVAEVVEQEGVLASSGEPITRTTFRAREVLKGSLLDATFTVPLPAGRWGTRIWLVDGTPSFRPGQEVLLFLQPRGLSEYGLSEFGLSKFDIVQDAKGRRFAVRSTFSEAEDRELSRLDISAYPLGSARRLEPFLEGLRKAGRGGVLSQPAYEVPAGGLQIPRGGLAPLWVNVGGREPGNCVGGCLFRWFWDFGDSPNAVVQIIGSQTNLSDGSNGHAAIASALAGWTSLPNTDIRFSGPSDSGNVEVHLDVEEHPGGVWFTAADCSGGIAGTGGLNGRSPVLIFKGDQYHFSDRATVRMRKNTCATGYPLNRYTLVAMHEFGHSMGLGHPDQASSVHSTTATADWNAAVMRSSLPNLGPAGPAPRTDDIQAMDYYYGTGAATCIPNLTTLCLAGGRFQVRADWRTEAGQTGAGMAIPETADTGMFWFFTSNNIEAIIKVLNACALNNRYWVFAGGLTNLEATITVTDTSNGSVRSYVNPLNTKFQPVQDTEAFATCP